MSVSGWVIFIVILLLVITLIILPFALATRISYPHHHSTKESIRAVKQQGSYGDYDELDKEDFMLSSYDGYQLHCTYVPAASRKFVIISHGHGMTKYYSLKYLHLFRQLGYNVIIYDDRGHGENKATWTTMGKRESKDLCCLIDETYRRFGSDISLGLHGESMGASLSIMALNAHPKVQFIVSDCGYGILRMLCEDQIHRMYHLPLFLLDLADKACQFYYGYSLEEIRPIDALPENEVPICFIHGANDHLTNCIHSKLMHEHNKGYSELHIFPDTDHAGSLLHDPVLYHQIISSFLKKIERQN